MAPALVASEVEASSLQFSPCLSHFAITCESRDENKCFSASATAFSLITAYEPTYLHP
jgi:hypothetical protein